MSLRVPGEHKIDTRERPRLQHASVPLSLFPAPVSCSLDARLGFQLERFLRDVMERKWPHRPLLQTSKFDNGHALVSPNPCPVYRFFSGIRGLLARERATPAFKMGQDGHGSVAWLHALVSPNPCPNYSLFSRASGTSCKPTPATFPPLKMGQTRHVSWPDSLAPLAAHTHTQFTGSSPVFPPHRRLVVAWVAPPVLRVT